MADKEAPEAHEEAASAPASSGPQSEAIHIPNPAGHEGEDWSSFTTAAESVAGSLGRDMIVNLETESGSEFNRDSDGDSASIATSWTSSTQEFRYEYGRRYHALDEKTYALPNDEKEMDRLELQHLIWSTMFNGKLHVAPLTDDIKDALDIGTGTGAWAVEFANQHPDCQVLGTDLSPIQPEYVPVNLSFIIDDANDDWPTEWHNKFDYIHTRALGMGIRNWDKFVDQAWRCLKPGGWLELQEFHMPFGCDDGSLTDGMALAVWGDMWKEASAKLGIDLASGLKHPERMRTKGFRHVREARLKCPIGPWAKGRREKEIGVLMLRDVGGNLGGVSLRMFGLVGHTKETTEELCEAAVRDMMSPRVHTYMPVDLSWGQKPRRSGLRDLSSIVDALPAA